MSKKKIVYGVKVAGSTVICDSPEAVFNLVKTLPPKDGRMIERVDPTTPMGRPKKTPRKQSKGK